MCDYLIIDGYNVINAWPELIRLKEINFEHARLKLIDILSDFAGFRELNVILVFDAHQVKGGVGSREAHQKIDVIYTQEGCTADMIIEKIVSQLADQDGVQKVYVATSDGLEQNIVLGKGAYRLSSRELLLEVEDAKVESKGYYQSRALRPYSLDSHLSESIKSKLEGMRRGRL